MDKVGVSFSEESTFADVGDTCIIVELVLETQTTSNTMFNFKGAKNTTTTEGSNEVWEAEELMV